MDVLTDEDIESITDSMILDSYRKLQGINPGHELLRCITLTPGEGFILNGPFFTLYSSYIRRPNGQKIWI